MILISKWWYVKAKRKQLTTSTVAWTFHGWHMTKPSFRLISAKLIWQWRLFSGDRSSIMSSSGSLFSLRTESLLLGILVSLPPPEESLRFRFFFRLSTRSSESSRPPRFHAIVALPCLRGRPRPRSGGWSDSPGTRCHSLNWIEKFKIRLTFGWSLASFGISLRSRRQGSWRVFLNLCPTLGIEFQCVIVVWFFSFHPFWPSSLWCRGARSVWSDFWRITRRVRLLQGAAVKVGSTSCA